MRNVRPLILDTETSVTLTQVKTTDTEAFQDLAEKEQSSTHAFEKSHLKKQPVQNLPLCDACLKKTSRRDPVQ